MAATSEQRARRIGRRHAADGVARWDLDGDGEARLMSALGHTAPTTERNAPRRWKLLCAYREAFSRAELERLEVAFEEAGGRGVDLAERIDELRAELGSN